MSGPAGSCTLRIWMPLLVALRRYSTFNSKSFGAPPRQMRNVFCLTGFSVELWPVNAPFAARQNAGSPSQFFIDEPSKMRFEPGVVGHRERRRTDRWRAAAASPLRRSRDRLRGQRGGRR